MEASPSSSPRITPLASFDAKVIRAAEAEQISTYGKRSRAVVEAYASESIRTHRYPGIAFRGEDHRRRAWVLGSGLDVWEIVALLRDFGSEQTLAQAYHLTPGQIRVALAYYQELADEIDELIALGRRSEEQLHARYPFIQTFEEAAAGAGR